MEKENCKDQRIADEDNNVGNVLLNSEPTQKRDLNGDIPSNVMGIGSHNLTHAESASVKSGLGSWDKENIRVDPNGCQLGSISRKSNTESFGPAKSLNSSKFWCQYSYQNMYPVNNGMSKTSTDNSWCQYYNQNIYPVKRLNGISKNYPSRW